MGISSRGWEDRVQTKKPFVERVWIFSGTIYYENNGLRIP